MHLLDAQDPTHLWLLHLLFLDDINQECQTFRDKWNWHPISGPDTNNKSPTVKSSISRSIMYLKSIQDLRLLGELQFGIYEKRNPSSESRSDTLPDATEIMDQAQANINHEAIHVPLHQNPFRSDEEEVLFFSDLCQTISQDLTPAGFGLTPEEWESGVYPMAETIRIGHRAAKYVEVSLADPIWCSRARLWCQSLSTLSFYLY